MICSKNENVVCEELDGGALLVDAKSGKRWRMNALAASAWKLCDGSRSAAEIGRLLRQPADLVAKFCAESAGLGLMRTAGGVSAGPGVMAFSAPFSVQPLGLGAGPRRRPNPRGLSGPG